MNIPSGQVPSFTASYSGFVAGQNASVLTVQPSFTTTAPNYSTGGLYAITPSGAQAENYSFNYVNGVLTIAAAALPTSLPSTVQTVSPTPPIVVLVAAATPVAIATPQAVILPAPQVLYTSTLGAEWQCCAQPQIPSSAILYSPDGTSDQRHHDAP